MKNSTLDLAGLTFDQRWINQLITDMGIIGDKEKINFWARIGIPYVPGEPKTVKFLEFIKAIVALTLAEPHAFGHNLTHEEFIDFMLRQGLNVSEANNVSAKMGWTNGVKKIASILTRLAKAVVR